MGVRPQHSSRTAGTACREISRTGRLRPEPEPGFLAGQKALGAADEKKQVGESELTATVRRIINPYRKEN